MLEKMGAWFAGPRTRWLTLIVWIAVAAILTLTLPAVGDKEKNNAPNLPEDSPSVVAGELIKEHFPNESGLPALLVWHREGGLNEQDYGHMQALTAELAATPLEGQESVIPLHEMPAPALMGMASEDGGTFVLPVSFETYLDTEIVKENIHAMQESIERLTGVKPFETAIDSASALSVRFSGPAAIGVDATGLFENADFVLMLATVLLVLVLLLLIYRSPILAFIPLVGVGFAYAVTSPILGWMAGEGWITVDGQAIAIMTVLLFGAGTDYCLFFITRFRQELEREGSRWTALKRSYKNATGAIAMSGFTVVLSLFALLFAKYGAVHRFAVPFSLSILIMMIASLTLVPALLSIIGKASFYPFIPRTEEEARALAAAKGKTYVRKDPERKVGAKVGSLVVRKPWTVVIVCLVLLGSLASFALPVKYTYDLLSTFPDDMPSVEGFQVISEAYAPGELAPVTVVVRSDGEAPADVAAKLSEHRLVDHVGEPVVSDSDPGLTSYSVVFNVNPYQQEAMDAIPELKEAAASALAGAGALEPKNNVWVGGQTAEQHDTQLITTQDNELIIPIVIGLIVVLLLAYLRSITATVYLVATVLLSYAAALGLGWVILHYVMGVDAIQGSIPLYAFVFLIALGEDYNIFMISSIWQKRKEMPLLQAIKEGVAETGGVITSAGLILAATFAVLATLPIQVLVQFGLITAIGVLMDTFIVRPFLVPAITAILGKRAFWPGKADISTAKPKELGK
ncbi:MAG: patched family protein [Paenibacillus sp.]|nr:patched family protein [Paenibacillus sp.]